MTRGSVGETYNVGGNNEIANIDLVKQLCEALDELVPESPHRPHADLITFVTDRPGHDLRYAIDATKLSTTLGWTPTVMVAEGLRRTVRWYLENRSWWEAIRARRLMGERLGLARSKAS